MFTPSKIESCFLGLVGFRNSTYDPDIGVVTDNDLLASSSGLYFNDFHPLIKNDVIENIIPQGQTLNAYLNLKVKQGANKLLNRFANSKKEMQSTKTLLNSSALFDSPARASNLVTAEGRFVGMEFKMVSGYGVKVVIDGLGLQFSQVQTNLPLYLFHSSQVDPILTETVTTTKAGSMEWVALSQKIDLSYYSDKYDTGGFFYFGYFEDDITGQAIKKDFNWEKGACVGCGNYNAVKIWNTRLDFLRVTPIYVSNSDLNGSDMFDYRDATYAVTNNFGLNLKTSIECDLSEYFCDKKQLFAEALGYQVSADILNDIKFSDRANRIVEVNRNMIIRDLEGDRNTNEIGILNRLQQSINGISFDFSKIDSPCLPCNNPNGVKIRSI